MLKIIILKDTRRVRKQPATRQNEEFGRACNSSGLIHEAFSSLISQDSSCRNYGKLTQRLMQIQGTDMINECGKRCVQAGEFELLEGFEFNRRKSLMNILRTRMETRINEVTGICWLSIPSFLPQTDLYYDGNASHVQITLAAACFDFASGWYSTHHSKSDYLSTGEQTSVHLATMVEVRDEHPIILLAGLTFYSLVNKNYYLARTPGGLCLSVVETARGIKEA